MRFFIEVEDYGTLSLADLAEKFDGELVTITIANNRQFEIDDVDEETGEVI